MKNLLPKILPILKTVGQVFQWLMLLSIFGMNLLMGYIMFAPDDFPKPFYLSYAGQTTGPVVIIPAAGTQAVVSEGAHNPNATEPASSENPGEAGGVVMSIDTGTKLVNLADPGGRRYLRAGVVLGLLPPAEVQAVMKETPKAGGEGATVNPLITAYKDKVNEEMAVINDKITAILSSKTFESIYTTDGKNALKEEIKTQLNEILPELQVAAVYFTEFVVQ